MVASDAWSSNLPRPSADGPLRRLPGRGFTCTPDAPTGGQTCTTSFSSDAKLSNPLGSGGSLRRQEVSVTVAFEGGMLTRMDFTRAVSTTSPDPSQANRLVERSANLVGD